jgi:CheY-like chemotaxis protein
MTLRCARILVVDDDPDVRESVGDALLVQEASTVVVLADGVDAAEEALARGFRPDAILLDLVMPLRGGEELIRRVLQDPELRGIPVFAMSAAVDRLGRVRGEVRGAFEKPFELDALLEALASSCQEHGA